MNYDEIVPNLYCGQKIDSQEFNDALVQEGITHVINLWSGIREPYWKGLTLNLNQDDDGTPRPPEQTIAGIEFAKIATKLYVHCQWGMGRAPSMIYAILRSRGMTQKELIPLINLRRPIAAKGNWERYIPSIERVIANY